MPEVGFVPDQPPEARHRWALVESQVRTEVSPLAMFLGWASILTAGAAPCGFCTVTVVLSDAEPAVLVQTIV